MAHRFLFVLPLLAACAASAAPAPVSPALALRRAQCAEENPFDRLAAVGCESDRARATRPMVVARRSPQRTQPAPVVLVAPAPLNAGQGLVDYGRQLAAPPVACTSIRMGSFTSTSCR